MLAKNDREVFLSCIDNIKEEKGAGSIKDGFDDLKQKQEMYKKAKQKNIEKR